MASYTEHYNLEKPEKTDYYDVETANKNNDIIDNKLYEKQDKQPGKGLSTNDFTNEYKKKIDALQRIYRYCGSVETIDDLNTIEERQRGDVYNVKNLSVDYCWNETEWTELGNAVDLSNYQSTEDAEQIRQDIDKELANKVDKVEGKGLSTNDFTDKYKALLDGLEIKILEKTFPIGSTYITQEDINPSTILEFGTWERIKGKVLAGLDEDDEDFNEIGKTGGEKEHTLTVEEMPKHTHIINASYGAGWSANGPAYGNASEVTEINPTAPTGGDQPHNNLQPYEVVGYMWIRRA